MGSNTQSRRIPILRFAVLVKLILLPGCFWNPPENIRQKMLEDVIRPVLQYELYQAWNSCQQSGAIDITAGGSPTEHCITPGNPRIFDSATQAEITASTLAPGRCLECRNLHGFVDRFSVTRWYSSKSQNPPPGSRVTHLMTTDYLYDPNGQLVGQTCLSNYVSGDTLYCVVGTEHRKIVIQ